MRYRVIIIDDEAWTREVIRSLGNWDQLNLEIVGEASDGDFGIELVRQLKPDIVITDVNMPKMNGLELISLMRNAGSKAQVIIISGHDDFDYIHGALKLGVLDYLLKPIKPDELNKQLAQCVTLLDEESEKLKIEGESILRFELSTYEFLKATWADAFNQLKTSAYEALFIDDDQQIKDAFSRMRDLFDVDIENASNKSDLIYIYYSLIAQLQNFISENGFNVKDIFTMSEFSFVFSQECTSYEMIDFINVLYLKAAQSVKQTRLSRNKLDISKVKRYIDENFQNQVTLEQTATRFYISKEHLSKVFKVAYGEGFIEYLNAVRLEKAKQLIIEKGIPIKEVGYLVGYIEQAHFYKKFKRYFGMTPGEMRETLKMDNK
ncbi:response regulator [Fusibacter bizertensis]